MHFTHFESILRNMLRENANRDDRFRKYSVATMRKCGSLALSMGTMPIPLESGGMTALGTPSAPPAVSSWGIMNPFGGVMASMSPWGKKSTRSF